MPQGKGTYGSQRGRPPMKRLSETDTKGSLLNKFKTFMFKGKEFTTKTRDEAVKAFQRLIAKHGSSPEQVEKSAREIRVSHGIPHPKKKKK